MWALGTSFQFCQVWVFVIVIPHYCLRFLTFNESETHGCQWLQCIVWFCFGFFILYINQICQTSVLLILVTKRGLSNVKISRETSIVNASVAGREKHVKKVIGFHYLSYLEQSCIGFCYILQWSLILCCTTQKSQNWTWITHHLWFYPSVNWLTLSHQHWYLTLMYLSLVLAR